MNTQLSIFDLDDNKVEVKDVRTDGQINRRVSYDVGEVVSGSRKHEYALKKEFEQLHSTESLKKLEQHSAVIAAEMVTKKELFKEFSLESEKRNGTDPVIARVKQLIIQRINNLPQEDSKEGREDYLNAINFIRKEMKSILTIEELIEWVYRIRDIMFGNKLEQSIDKHQLSSLGKKFINFFFSAKSANGTINRVERQVKSWNDLLNKPKRTKRVSNKPVWERELPDSPSRIGGISSDVQSPDSLMTTFDLRSVQFGHYLDDSRALEHIIRCSEAFYDLMDMLNIVNHSSISFKGTLAMAFGSRGRGSALGHYEPNAKIINLTRDRGTLGVLAHEWFHGLDNWLYNQSHDHKNGVAGYMTELINIGDGISPDIKSIFEKLTDAMTIGNSISYVRNNNKKGDSWRLSNKFKQIYKDSNGSLLDAIRIIKSIADKDLSKRIELFNYYSTNDKDKRIKQAVRKRDREVAKSAQALAWYHEQENGNRVEEIPVPSDKTEFYQAGITLDRGNVGRYWSSSVELAARAFESYIEDKLTSLNRRNDYLVCGTKDKAAFPVEGERNKINNIFDKLFDILLTEGYLV